MSTIAPPARVQPRPGYALLVTLVMLGLLGVILGGLARMSADTALRANAEEDRVRTRWAELSCQRVLLDRARERASARTDAWLRAHADGQPPSSEAPPPICSESIVLHLEGLDLYVRIDDEQAKINVNRAAYLAPEPTGQAATTTTINENEMGPLQLARVREALGPWGTAELSPTQAVAVNHLGLKPLESWGQVLPNPTPEGLLGLATLAAWDRPSPQALASSHTLWGDGRLNLTTTPQATIRDALGSLVDPATLRLLLQLHEQAPDQPLNTLIEQATEDPDERSVFTRHLTRESRCYGMWLAVVPGRGQPTRPRWSFRVIESASSTAPPTPSLYRW